MKELYDLIFILSLSKNGKDVPSTFGLARKTGSSMKLLSSSHMTLSFVKYSETMRSPWQREGTSIWSSNIQGRSP